MDDWIRKYEDEADEERRKNEEYKRKRTYQLEKLRESGLPDKLEQIYKRLKRIGQELHYGEDGSGITILKAVGYSLTFRVV